MWHFFVKRYYLQICYLYEFYKCLQAYKNHLALKGQSHEIYPTDVGMMIRSLP